MRVVVPARNEQGRIAGMLASVFAGLHTARRLGADWQSEVLVVLDRCNDQTRELALAAGAEVRSCPFPHGKVEALRTGMDSAVDIHVCIDADVRVGARTLFDLVETLRSEPQLQATCPPLRPDPLRGMRTPLSWALHRYNAARGFSSERLWLSGRCYAVRRVHFPGPLELRMRAQQVPPALRFPGLSGPLVADDVWLSRALLARGEHTIRHLATDPVQYRAPSSYRGMARTYRRLRRELRRVDLLFPELPSPGRDRRVDSVHGVSDRLALALFRGALLGCRAEAWLEERLSRWLGRAPDPWQVVTESKLC